MFSFMMTTRFPARFLLWCGMTYLAFCHSAWADDWKPDAKLASSLGPKVSLGTFSIRPPKGCEYFRTTRVSDRIDAWSAEKPSPGKPFTGFSITTISLSQEDKKSMRGVTPDLMAAIFLRNFFRNWSDVKVSPNQKGTIAGVSFVRYAWAATSPNGVPVRGFGYVTLFKDCPVVFVAAQRESKAAGDLLRVCDQAALSFQAN
jgi:hypothetical protein